MYLCKIIGRVTTLFRFKLLKLRAQIFSKHFYLRPKCTTRETDSDCFCEPNRSSPKELARKEKLITRIIAIAIINALVDGAFICTVKSNRFYTDPR